ncbi:hypothetical protein LPJ75_004527, partial [Coemansia sp. RSA 2598]
MLGQQFHQSSQSQQQNSQTPSSSGLDQGYDGLLRSMSQMLAQGPPISGSLQNSWHRMIESVCRSGLSAASSANMPAKTVVDGLDEEKLWRLYTKSEDVLPNGSRARNLLWRMQ